MSVEQNEALVRMFVDEVWNGGNVAAAGDVLARDFALHDTLWGEIRGLDAVKQWWSGVIFASFSEVHMSVEDMFGEGDKVAHRWVTKSTHSGPLAGVPPTGKRLTWTGMSIYRFADGKIAELWMNQDHLGVVQQLGLVPPMGG